MSERFEVIDPLNKKLGVIEENITKFKNDMGKFGNRHDKG